jgi:hypothetical protein
MVMTLTDPARDRGRNPALRRLAVAALSVATCLGGLSFSGLLLSAEGTSFPQPVPEAKCGPGARPETDIQGRVPQRDYDNGRVRRGYQCNTRMVSHQGTHGGFKTLRYTDRTGRTCAFYDSTRLFPADALFQARSGLGVVVLDMTDPAEPRRTANLATPAMLSPHESLLVEPRRGLLAAVVGNPMTNVGILEIYDVRADCRRPVLLSSTSEPILGHESGWSPDGRTFYASSTGGQTLAAIDVSNPREPKRIFEQFGVNYHGLRFSRDGRTMYAANIGNDLSGGTFPGEGLRIIDVSEIQDRLPDPQITVLSDLVWREGSIPQVSQPFRRGKRDYLLQVDEFAKFGLGDIADAPVGAARIIDVTDPRHPEVISHLRLQVHQPAGRRRSINDPGAGSPVGGYTGHYCSAPYQDDPKVVACSMIASGLRIFDIRDLRNPKEVGYFNRPTEDVVPLRTGANAMSQPAWDVKRRSVWYTDGTSGFYVVKLTNGIGQLLAR